MGERQTEGTISLSGILSEMSVAGQHRRHDVIAEFADLAAHPPGKDPYMGAFYEAMGALIQKNGDVEQLITETLQERDITPKHLANLLFRGVQFIELFHRRNQRYPYSLNTPDAWTQELADIMHHDQAVLRDVLLTKDTTTTIYQRYIGTRVILNALLPNRPLAVADFGCGGNYGLRGIALDEPFKPFIDHTPGRLVTQLVQQPLKLHEGLAIDRENPLDADTTRWRLACSFYPQELNQLPDVIALEKRLQRANNVRFFQGDLRTLPVGSANVPVHSYDAVVMSTMCYQLPYEDHEGIMHNAARMITPDGIIIVQDFAEKDGTDPTRLNFAVNWFKTPFSYRNFIAGPRTNWEMKEVLRWNNGRCEEVMPGEDFSYIDPLVFAPAA